MDRTISESCLTRGFGIRCVCVCVCVTNTRPCCGPRKLRFGQNQSENTDKWALSCHQSRGSQGHDDQRQNPQSYVRPNTTTLHVGQERCTHPGRQVAGRLHFVGEGNTGESSVSNLLYVTCLVHKYLRWLPENCINCSSL